ncbi:zinc finger protein 888-like [Contarinia nasturtii]|uniref:zinc finger protein 888-like n=1 Tax=Contarinia nasturtii TaxID=265458 RepID=UPI0012D3CBDF|nr:zinc finger protein 888-like [Contarinia nasturtii]
MAETKICRLCISSSTQLLDIFDDSDTSLIEILNEHIGEVCKTDALPKWICCNCWDKIEEFHRFHRFVRNAQEDYLKQIVKYEEENDIESNCRDISEQTNFVEVISNYDELNEFVDELSTKSDALDDTDEKPTKSETTESEFPDVLFNAGATTAEETALRQLTELECDSISSTSYDIDSMRSKEIFDENFDTTCDICSIELKSLRRAITHYKNEHQIDDGYIKCCGLKLKRDKLVADHIKWHEYPEMFKCKYCDRIMKTKLSLSTHIAKHRHAKSYTCDICDKIFPEINKIREHMMRHSNNLTCHICSKLCTSKEKLESHLKFYHKHDEVRRQWNTMLEAKKMTLDAAEIDRVIANQFDMKCDYCDVIFKSLQEAQYHYMEEHHIAEGYIQCCGLKFKRAMNIQGHVLWHLRPDLFKCCICKKDSTTIIALRAHLRVHEARSTPQQNVCKECNKTFFSKHHLTRHMKLSHGIEKKKLSTNTVNPDSNSIKLYFDMKCELCKIEVSSLQHAKLHYLEEHDIPDGYIKCCDMKFRELKNINDHLQYHMNPSIFKCEICMKVFPRKADLSAHLSQHKAFDTKRFTCNECGKAWKSKYRLDVHKRSHEEKTARNFPCDYCNRKFSTETLKKSHVFRIHESNKEAKTEICEYCAKTFTTRKEVLSHIRSMHMENSIRRERAQCQICSAWLSNRYTLKDHMMRHNSEPQKCSQCDKISPNQHALLCHVREVHCERIYRCHLCEKTFKAAVALKDHISTHTGEKTYKCSFCPEAFIWRPNMYSHQKKAHPEEWKKTKSEVRRRINRN